MPRSGVSVIRMDSRTLSDPSNGPEPTLYQDILYGQSGTDEVLAEFALIHNTGFDEKLRSFANNISTPEGGTHVTGFRQALTRAINDYARKQGMLKESDPSISREELSEGMTAVISVRLKEPQFEGQTKTKLGNADIRGLVEGALFDGLSTFFRGKPAGGKDGDPKMPGGAPGAGRGAQGPGNDAAQGGIGIQLIAWEIGGLLGKGSKRLRNFHRRGRFRRRQRQAGTR